MERRVGKKGTVLNKTAETFLWIQRIARLTVGVIWGCAPAPPPPQSPAPPNPTAHMNVLASSPQPTKFLATSHLELAH